MMRTSENSLDKPTLVLVHGFLDSSATWHLLKDELCGQCADCIVPDLRGAGDKVHSGGPYSLNQAVTDVLASIDPDVRNLVFVGHSMGAQIAELAAARASDRTRALVLITPTPLEGNALPDDARALLRQAGGNVTTQQKIRQIFSVNFPTEMLLSSNIMGPEAVEGYYDAFTTGTPDGLRPALFTGPTLIIGAKKDPVIPPDMVSSIHQKRFSDAQLCFIDASGHWPQVEQPTEVAAQISTFLGLQPGRFEDTRS